MFGEGPGGFVVSGAPEDIAELHKEAANVPFVSIGEVGGNRLDLTASAARLSLPVEALRSAYEQAIPDLLT
jgi:hypothetical protein